MKHARALIISAVVTIGILLSLAGPPPVDCTSLDGPDCWNEHGHDYEDIEPLVID